MKIGIIAAGIFLTLWYEVCGVRHGAWGMEHGAWGMGHGENCNRLSVIGGSVNGFVEVVKGAGQSVADSIVAVDPDRVRLEAALDPAVIIIDVRMKMEYRRGHIEKSVHLPKKSDLMEFAARTSVSRPLYLYCTTETRSRQAAKILVGAGFERVFIIEGGFNKWKKYGLPIEKR